MSPSSRSLAGLPVLALAYTLLAVPPTAAAPPSPPPSSFQVDSPSPGRLDVSAKGASIAEVLAAMGQRGGFTVEIDPDVERPPVWATISEASVDEAVRSVLRRRSYTLQYGADGKLDRVVVLSPPDPAAEAKRKAEEHRQQQQQRLLEQRRLQRSRTRVNAVEAVRHPGR